MEPHPKTAEAISCVHQGSVIGPKLVVICVFDLHEKCTAKSLLCADDVNSLTPPRYRPDISPKNIGRQRQVIRKGVVVRIK